MTSPVTPDPTAAPDAHSRVTEYLRQYRMARGIDQIAAHTICTDAAAGPAPLLLADLDALLSAVASLTQQRDEAREMAAMWEQAEHKALGWHAQAVEQLKTARADRDAAREQAEQAQAAVAAVRKLHSRDEGLGPDAHGLFGCMGCDPGETWPCATLRALDATAAPQPKEGVGPDWPNDFDPVTGRIVPVVYPPKVKTDLPAPCGSVNPDMPFAACTYPPDHGPIRIRVVKLGDVDVEHGNGRVWWNGSTATIWADELEPAAAVPSSGAQEWARIIHETDPPAAFVDDYDLTILALAEASGGPDTAADHRPRTVRRAVDTVEVCVSCGELWPCTQAPDADPATAGGTASSEQCVCAPDQYCHLDNCRNADGPGETTDRRRFYLRRKPSEWREVGKAEYVRAERSAGFHNTLGQPDEPATHSFSAAAVEGRTEYAAPSAAGVTTDGEERP